MYKSVDDEIVGRLRDIVGDSNVSVADEDRETYSHDETTGLKYLPEVVVKATDTAQVAKILTLANEEKIPVTPRGGGTGLSGGAVPLFGGILLSLEKMDRILEIDTDNLMVTVQPGLITGNLQREVERHGLFYPPDPASLDSCSIGGNIAEGAGGPRAVRYGVTKDYVCGLEAVLPSGEVIRMGGKIVKNATGYNLMDLLIGSEGTLAVITEITFRLLLLPKLKVDLLVPFNDLDSAAATVSEIIRNRVVPTTIEFMEKEAIKASERFLGKQVPFDNAEAHLLIEVDGNRKEDVESEYETVGEICLDNGAADVLVADSSTSQERLWEARRAITEALEHMSPVIVKEDVVVPRSQIPALLKGIRETSERYSISIVNFGHAGDGNVHVNILKRDMPDEEWSSALPKALKGVFETAISLGGMLSGEHGIGIVKRDYLPLALDDPQIELMRGIKKTFDPNNILNPGKIFPYSG